jgi:hypothetical protein
VSWRSVRYSEYSLRVPDSAYTQSMVRVERKSLYRLLVFPAVSLVVLISLTSIDTYAQEDNETCPCFSYEEVESMFLNGAQLTAAEGESTCRAKDYSVECNAEVIVWDQNYTTLATAFVEWFDFDSGRCAYIDTVGNPGVERKVRWPHPAPEATARACFNIISSVIKKSDTSGKCDTFP